MTVAIALVAGMVAQAIAFNLRLPGIVILLVLGVLLGRDGLGIVRPDVLGGGLDLIVSFAAAVILFEAGLNLQWRRLQSESVEVRRLATVGALLTWAGAALVARALMGWDWRPSLLFGALVIVTGPTVVAPLLRRIRVNRNLQALLEAESISLDAIGAILAVIAFELTYGNADPSLGSSLLNVLLKLSLGTAVGAACGALAVYVHRSRRVIPQGMEKLFTLTLAWVAFQAGNRLAPDSGIAAVVVAGLVVGNVWLRDPQRLNELRDFKEPFTLVVVGLMFIVVAAGIHLDAIAAIGVRGLLVAAALTLLVRPLQVVLCTAGSDLNRREKAFISWISPRGIVAATLAVLFAQRMDELGVADGEAVSGLVMLVIVATVLVQGLSGAAVAARLGVRRPRGKGFVILGANDLALALAHQLRNAGDEVVLVDANPELCVAAERKGFRVLNGNALDDRIIQESDLDTRKGVVALLPNGGVNLLFARRAIDENRSARVYVAMHRGAITPAHVKESRARVWCGSDVDVDLWASRLRRNGATLEAWRLEKNGELATSTYPLPRDARHIVLPIAFARQQIVLPTDERWSPRPGDVVSWLVFARRADEAREWLAARGWVQIPQEEPVS